MASCIRACLPACLELAATAQRSGSGIVCSGSRAARRAGIAMRAVLALHAVDDRPPSAEHPITGTKRVYSYSRQKTGYRLKDSQQYLYRAVHGSVSCRRAACCSIKCKRCCGEERRETLERRGGRLERTKCAWRADQTRHSAACAPWHAAHGAGAAAGPERLVPPCRRPRLSTATPPPSHRRRACRAPHHRAWRCPRAVSCASHERPRHRREGPPRRAAAEPLLQSPISSSSRTSHLHQRASGRPPRFRLAAEPRTPWPGASTVASTHSTDCRPQSQAIGAGRQSSRKRIALGRSGHGRSRA